MTNRESFAPVFFLMFNLLSLYSLFSTYEGKKNNFLYSNSKITMLDLINPMSVYCSQHDG